MGSEGPLHDWWSKQKRSCKLSDFQKDAVGTIQRGASMVADGRVQDDCTPVRCSAKSMKTVKLLVALYQRGRELTRL